MVIAGGVLIATGVGGGPVGMMLVGAGIAARAGFMGLRATAVAGVSSGSISGRVHRTYGYYAVQDRRRFRAQSVPQVRVRHWAPPGWIHNPMANIFQRADDNSIAHRVLGGAINSVDENFNRAWINTQVNSGKRIVDIGVDL